MAIERVRKRLKTKELRASIVQKSPQEAENKKVRCRRSGPGTAVKSSGLPKPELEIGGKKP
jgi:hypothetical protein